VGRRWSEGPDCRLLLVELAMTTQNWSQLKPAEKFALTWEESGHADSDMTLEYRFHPRRKFAFDFAWPSCCVAVEIHGFGYGHQAQQQVAKDCEKLREAIMLGWVVLPFTTRCIGSRANCLSAVEMVCELLSKRHGSVTWKG
jgi:hypothetical protein